MLEHIDKDQATETVDAKAVETVEPRLCECGKPTISENNPLCPSCMAARGNEVRWNKKNQKTAEKTPNHKNSPSAIVVEFNDYQDILEQLTKDAHEQIRTISGQIIWTLKNATAL